jgi:hypothetical protein
MNEIELVKGGLFELSVEIDGKKVLDHLWYPLPSSLGKRAREVLNLSSLANTAF